MTASHNEGECVPTRLTAPVKEKEDLAWGQEGPRFFCFLLSTPVILHDLKLKLLVASLEFYFIAYYWKLRCLHMWKSEDNFVKCFLSLSVQGSTQCFSYSSIAVIEHCDQGKF